MQSNASRRNRGSGSRPAPSPSGEGAYGAPTSGRVAATARSPPAGRAASGSRDLAGRAGPRRARGWRPARRALAERRRRPAAAASGPPRGSSGARGSPPTPEPVRGRSSARRRPRVLWRNGQAEPPGVRPAHSMRGGRRFTSTRLRTVGAWVRAGARWRAARATPLSLPFAALRHAVETRVHQPSGRLTAVVAAQVLAGPRAERGTMRIGSGLKAPRKGEKLAVLLPGMGAVATTAIAGVAAVRRKLAAPGRLADAARAPAGRRGRRTDRCSATCSRSPALDDLVFGGWDPIPDDAYRGRRPRGRAAPRAPRPGPRGARGDPADAGGVRHRRGCAGSTART